MIEDAVKIVTNEEWKAELEMHKVKIRREFQIVKQATKDNKRKIKMIHDDLQREKYKTSNRLRAAKRQLKKQNMEIIYVRQSQQQLSSASTTSLEEDPEKYKLIKEGN